MSKRVFWKKGMRLTDEVLTKSDNCVAEVISKVFALCASGNLGLSVDTVPFSLSIDINKNIIDVVSINCMGITRNGSLIDVHFDTNYTNTFNTKTSIPDSNVDSVFLLYISVSNEWRETNDGMCEPEFSFELMDENSPIPPNALPIARIVYDENCWRTDEISFVPPCLFIASLDIYKELFTKFRHLLNQLDIILPHKFATGQKDALKIYWPIIQQLSITVDKERDMMSPMALLGNIQKCVSGFLMACTLDEYINLDEPEPYQNYIHSPYSQRNVYEKIKEGLELCELIYTKIDNFDKEEPVVEHTDLPTPTIDSSQLHKSTNDNKIRIKIQNVLDGSVIMYALNGSDNFVTAKSNPIVISSHFNKRHEAEPDENVMIKIRTEQYGRYSPVSAYNITVTKDWKHIKEI